MTTTETSENRDNFDINLYHTINQEKQSVVGFKKSEIKFKDYIWFINEQETNDNKIIFDKFLNNFDFQKISLSHNDQKIDFIGTMRDSTYKDFQLTFNEVDLKKVTPTIENLSFNGKINGNVKYKQDKFSIDPQSNVTIDSLQINNIVLGDLNFDIEGNDTFNEFQVK